MEKGGNVFKERTTTRKRSRVRSVFALWVLTVLLCMSCGSVYAFDVPTGSEDWKFSFDSTLRYNLMYRVASQNQAIVNSLNGDDGDRNFDKGIVQNRLDLLEELDLTYKPLGFGVRFSGAFWYDQQYHNRFDNDSVATSNVLDENGHQVVNRLYKHADRFYAGPSGELLDAFIFGKVDLGTTPVYLKLGRHIYSWGQSLLDPIHAISYGQMPLDLGKAASVPGIEAKEMYRPLNSASAVAQITPTFQLAAQYFLQWERNVLPDAGTYFGSSDVCIDGEGAYMIAPGFFAKHGRDIEAARNKDFGLAAQWSPGFLSDSGTTLGFYYRRFSDKMPTLILNTNSSANPNDWTYHAAYKSNIDLLGASVGTQIFGLSWGAEVSYRLDMPLNGSSASVTSAAQLPDDGDILGPTGDVMFGLVNVMGLLKKTALWDAGSWMAEFDYAGVMRTADHEELYSGNSDAFGHATRQSGSAVIVFSPQYLQILQGLDLMVPVSLSYGLFGVGPTAATTGEGDGNFGLGLNFLYLQKYNFNFTYSNFFGKLEDSLGSAVPRGTSGLYRDRDFVSFTFKVSF